MGQTVSSGRRWVAAVAVALGVCLACALFVTTKSADAADGAALQQVSGLTGEAVGVKLGLSREFEGCDWTFAEYDGNNNGFCVAENVSPDAVERRIIAFQINGYEATDAVRAYCAAFEEYRASGLDLTDPRGAEMVKQLNELRGVMEKEATAPANAG